MRKGRDFELLYNQLYDSLDKAIYTIKSPAYLTDQITLQPREVDVLIEFTDANKILRRISVECRDRESVQDVLWIEQLITKKNDLNIDITIATTTSTFTEPAIKKASAYGIVLETAECINSDFISEMTKNKFATFTYMYARVDDIGFITNHNTIINKEQIKAHFNQAFITDLEVYLNNAAYWSIDIESIIKEPEKRYKCHFVDAKPFPVEVKINIEKDTNLQIECNSQPTTDIVIRYIVQPVNYTIPIVAGIITKTPNNDNIKNQIAEYNAEGHSSKFTKLNNEYLFDLAIENKNPYLRFIGFFDVAIMPFEITQDSILKFSIKDPYKLLGKLDFSYLW